MADRDGAVPERFWGDYQGGELAAEALKRLHSYRATLKSTRRHERMRRSWLHYYARGKNGSWTEDTTEIGSAGVQGELTTINPNHYRNLIQHQLNLVTQKPPAYEVVAVNTDSESLEQAILGNGILDYYHRMHGLSEVRKRRAEIALVLGESVLHAPWDPMAGKEQGVEDYKDGEGKERQRLTYEGDFRFGVLSPYNFAYDGNSPNYNDPDWWQIQEVVNRWDLLAQYPAYEAEIREAEPAEAPIDGWTYDKNRDGIEDYVTVTWLYFKRSPKLPGGKEALILNAETTLYEGELSYERPPVFRLAPSDVIFQPGGYTNNFDLLPIVEAYQALMTTILSNQTAFGVQLIAAPKGSNVKPNHLARGLTLVEYNPGDGPPQALNLLHTAPETFEFVKMLGSEMEKLSVINAAVRGDPEATKGDSGSKAALIHSTAQQFATGFAQALQRSDEEIATHILATLRDHVQTERVATIAGKYNAYASREFVGDDLEPISRVLVHGADAMKDTIAGKQELAGQLMALPGGIQTAEQYLQFMQTGRLEPMYEAGMSQLMLIRRENESLTELEDPDPLVSPFDQHAQHIAEHCARLADPVVRRDPQIVARIQKHLDWHMESLTPGMPRFAGMERLMATGQKPFPGPAAPPGGAPEGPPVGGMPKEGETPAAHGGPPKPPQGGNGDADGPAMPKPPINPATGQRAQVPVPQRPV